jgi:hypothetical protein
MLGNSTPVNTYQPTEYTTHTSAAAGLLSALAKAFACWAAALHLDSSQQQRLRQLSNRKRQHQLDQLAHPIGQPVLLWQQLLVQWPGAIMGKRVALTETFEPAAALGASLLHVVTLQHMRGICTEEFMVGSVCSSSAFGSSSSSSSSDAGDSSSSSSSPPAANSSSSSSRPIMPVVRGVSPRNARDTWLMVLLCLPGMLGNRLLPEVALSHRTDMEVLFATVPGLFASPELILGSLLHVALTANQLHETLKGKSPVRAAQAGQQQQQQRKGRILV